MGLFGSLLGQVLGGGEKPKVPEAPDLGEAQKRAIQLNLEALPGAQELVSKANAFSQEQITKMLSMVIPNYGTITGTAGKNIESLLKGEIPKDVQESIGRSDAAKAISGGYAGTTFHTNLLARDLGLTSLDLTQQGLTSAERWIQMMDQLYSPGTMSVTSMFVSPMQEFAAKEQEWGVEWLKNQIGAMPDLFGQALGEFLGGIGDAAASMSMSYFGGNSGIPSKQVGYSKGSMFGGMQ